ncbi:hypothetical protein [Nonomuraea dietziae]|uniref:hypothetical protein n=1 Tax=Nonomuraea dietziae TaxID=65515 RepID=UPI0031D29F31
MEFLEPADVLRGRPMRQTARTGHGVVHRIRRQPAARCPPTCVPSRRAREIDYNPCA